MSDIDDRSLVPDWILEENKDREAVYTRDNDQEAFLYQFNEILAPYEERIAPTGEVTYPVILFFGLPRCGKTFFSQVLTYCLDLGYPNNLVARFWRAPVCGIRLSDALSNVVQDSAPWTSDYGKTPGINGPHDFSYFWHYWLKVSRIPYDRDKMASKIDWGGLRRELLRMGETWRRASIFKGVLPSYHLERFALEFQDVIYVYVERDLIDCAVSLARGRRDNFGSLDHWYGQTPLPDDYRDVASLQWADQIAGQLKHLLALYEEGLMSVPSQKVIRVNYADFCSSPDDALESVRERVRELHGIDVVLRRDPMSDAIRLSRHDRSAEIYTELEDALFRWDLPVRFD